MKRIGLILPLALFALTGCDGLTGHASVAAKAGSQELSTERLAELITSSGIPLQPEMEDNKPLARAIADVWLNYQLMGQAAARNDSLNSPEKLDEVLWQQINQIKISKFAEQVSRTWAAADTIATEADYNQGEFLSAAHILFMFPQGGSPAQLDSVRAEAERVRRQVTAANFAEMVRLHSKDPGSVQNGGLYAAFPRGYMAKEFEDAVLALQPGQISGLVQTMYGYHIIRRPEFAEVRAQHGQAKGTAGVKAAESTFVAKVEAEGNIEVKTNVATVVKQVVEDVEGNRENKTVLATSKAGRFTAGDLAKLIRAFPQRQQVIQQLSAMPDSVVPLMLTELVRTDLIVMMADSAGVEPEPAELESVRSALSNVLFQAWNQLGVAPAMLGDSAQNLAERSRAAAAKVDEYVNGMIMQSRDYIDVPEPLETLLRSSFPNKVNEKGLISALEKVAALRAASDSTGGAPGGMPSQVPMGAPPGGAPGTTPPPAVTPPPTGADTNTTPPPAVKSGGGF